MAWGVAWAMAGVGAVARVGVEARVRVRVRAKARSRAEGLVSIYMYMYHRGQEVEGGGASLFLEGSALCSVGGEGEDGGDVRVGHATGRLDAVVQYAAAQLGCLLVAHAHRTAADLQHGTCMVRAWCMRGACRVHAWCVQGVHAWHTHACSMAGSIGLSSLASSLDSRMHMAQAPTALSDARATAALLSPSAACSTEQSVSKCDRKHSTTSSCIHHAYAMHIPCMCHAYTMQALDHFLLRTPCICHAYTMHMPCLSVGTSPRDGHRRGSGGEVMEERVGLP